MKDLYKTLGVAEDADDAAIKKAYRKLAKEYHPDVTGGDKKKTERFKEINEAYGVLGDEQKRAEYDRLKHAPGRPDGMPEGFDADAFARTFGGGGGAAASQFGGDFGDLGDIFSSLFGGGRGGGRGARAVGGRARTRPSARRGHGRELPMTLRARPRWARSARSARAAAATVEVTSRPASRRAAGCASRAGRARAAAGRCAGRSVPRDRRSRPIRSCGATARHRARPAGHVAEAALGTKVDVPTVEGPVTRHDPAGHSSGAKLRLRGAE